MTEQRIHERMNGHRDAITELDRRTTRSEARIESVESQVGQISDSLSQLTAQQNANHGETTRQLQQISGQLGEQRGRMNARVVERGAYIGVAGLLLSVVAMATKVAGVW